MLLYWTTVSTLLVAFTLVDGGGRPDRIDLCVILASGRSSASIDKGFAAIFKLVKRISISPSSTRIAFLDATTGTNEFIDFSSCLNRECIKAELARMRSKMLTQNASNSYHQTKVKPPLLLVLKLFQKHKRPRAKKYVLLITAQPLSLKTIRRLQLVLAQRSILLVTSVLGSSRKGYTIVRGAVTHLSSLPFEKEYYTRCFKSGVVYDECNRKCLCASGEMTKCTRVRKEFTEMSKVERRRFISAFKTLAADPRYKMRHESFVKIHKDLFFKGIHTKNYFLPWHRWYMLKFENLLREVDCRITIPYWDWAFWSDVSWVKNIHIWNSHDYGLGGNGDPNREYCVQDGPFKEGSFKTPDFDNKGKVLNAVAYAVESTNITEIKTPDKAGCLRRSFNGRPIGVPLIKKILRSRAASFAVFETVVRVSLHNSMHNEIGGHMCSQYASVAPEFFLHHTFLDKLWYTWQQHSKACLNARFANFNRKMTKFKCHHSQKEFIDSSKLPGHVAVTYTDYYYAYEMVKGNDTGETLDHGSAAYESDDQDSPVADEPVIREEYDTDKGATWPPYKKHVYHEFIYRLLGRKASKYF